MWSGCRLEGGAGVEVLCNRGAHRIEARRPSDRRVWLQAADEFRVCVSESIKRSDLEESATGLAAGMVLMYAYRMCAFGGMLCRVVSVLWPVLSVVSGFNLHAERPAVYRGPEGSYFGYSVDFYRPTPESSTLSVLVGAPKANTSQPGIIEGGAVYYCPYPPNPDPTKQPHSCSQIPFDNANNRMIKVNGTREPLEFKSHQWFGASVRTHKGKVVACAPLYHWRTVKVNDDPDPEGQGFCQAGFSVDFTKEGTLVVGGPGSFYWQGDDSRRSRDIEWYDDVLVGAPLYMERERESKPKEVGRVYLYLQHSPLTFSEPLLLTGTHTFGRFGTAIAPLGDLNQDGYNVQELYGAWASSSGLSGYGFTLRGDRDLDNNHYPDLIVGAFGKGEVSVYRARPVVSVEAEMILTPRILNPDDRSCLLTESDTMLQLDWLKGVRGGVKRVNFLDSHQPQHTGVLMLGHNRPHSCLNYTVYLRGEDEFRDKLTPISLALNYSLAPPPSNLDLPPVLNHYSSTFLQEQAYILLDCGEDNECIPNLQLSASMLNCEYRMVNDSRLVVCDLGNPMVAGTESNPVSLSLSISARAQLDLRGVCHPSQVVLPFPHWEPKEKPVKEEDVGPQVTHIYEVLTDGPISCRSNTSLNPLGLQTSSVQDTPELLGFLRNSSSPHRYRRATSVAQPYSSKTLNCSNIICLRVLCVVGRLDRGQSAVVKIRSRLWAHTFLQRRNDPYLLNSTVSFRVTALPYRLQPSSLPQHTTSMGTLVLWGTPDVAFAVPLWVIILAILLGLLVLAMLTLAMWKCGFFDRARPPADDVSDREQLTSDQSADA
ncbi:unnamed protein product [Coregonus sp. 'balchen']|nr:unnamed protein product [Coregonus sp. 'balchen']